MATHRKQIGRYQSPHRPFDSGLMQLRKRQARRELRRWLRARFRGVWR